MKKPQRTTKPPRTPRIKQTTTKTTSASWQPPHLPSWPAQ